MKIIYLTHRDYDNMDNFIKLRETEKIGDADVIMIKGERFKYAPMDPSERVDTEHFISYDYNDLHFGHRGIGGGENFMNYVLMSEKVLDRIKPSKAMITISTSEFSDIWKSLLHSVSLIPGPFILNIGDISDIAEQHTVDDFTIK